MKIGILTFHSCINYGSFWQALCLAEGIAQMGHKVEILDHHSGKVNFAEWKCALQPVLPTPVPDSDGPLYRKKIGKFFQALGMLPRSKPFPLEDPSQMDPYDLVIVGSDEVWNLSHPWYGGYRLFYGEGIRAEKLVAYAASFGNSDESAIPGPDFITGLRRFSSISVRDNNSQAIINKALGYLPGIVLDPCLLFPGFPLGEAVKTDFIKPYAAVYGHNFTQSFIDGIRAWARHRNIKLVSIGYRNDWADEQCITADPFEFEAFISGSQSVVTNFFHGCVFALINSKPFACETTPYRSNKVKSLMKITGGERHMVNAGTHSPEYFGILDAPVETGMISAIEDLRNRSINFLAEATGVLQLQPR